MKIGIMSDSHDNEENLQKAIKVLEEKDIKILIHCGDFCSPFMTKELTKFKGEVYCVFGNTDDVYRTTKISIENGIKLLGNFGEIELDNKKIAIIHDNVLAALIAESNKHDIVFYGHSHVYKIEKIKDCLLVNPGELYGKKEHPGFIIYDTESNKIEHFDI